MFMLYLLWVTIVFGGLFMGIGSVWTMVTRGFDLALLLNALLYSGCALYGLPRLVKLVLGKS